MPLTVDAAVPRTPVPAGNLPAPADRNASWGALDALREEASAGCGNRGNRAAKGGSSRMKATSRRSHSDGQFPVVRQHNGAGEVSNFCHPLHAMQPTAAD